MYNYEFMADSRHLHVQCIPLITLTFLNRKFRYKRTLAWPLTAQLSTSLENRAHLQLAEVT